MSIFPNNCICRNKNIVTDEISVISNIHKIHKLSLTHLTNKLKKQQQTNTH